MSLARLAITAVKIEGHSKSELARDYGVSQVWVQKLAHRFETEGAAAFPQFSVEDGVQFQAHRGGRSATESSQRLLTTLRTS